MRLVGAWKKSESDKAAVAAKNAGMEKETKVEKDEREKRREEEAESALKVSTDKMSVVFDWLIERVPAPTTMFPPGSNRKGRQKENIDEEMRKSAATFRVGVGDSSSSLDTPASTPSIPQQPTSPLAGMKELMEGERRQRANKNELASKQDLERFYIALAKLMWDSGL
jgi:triacylglycerol lipase